MIIDWPSDLISDVARRRCVLFLGAGISNQARNATGQAPKRWREFLNAATDRLYSNKGLQKQTRRLIKTGDYLTACQVIKDELGPTDFHDFVKSEFLLPQFAAAIIHDRIIDLDSRIVATPNFDKLFENRINQLQNSSVLVKNYYDTDLADVIRGTARMVLKVHGTIDTPQHMIFTRSDYARARNTHANFYAILQALAMTHTFVFLGCGLDDPDTRLLLEDYAFKHDFGRPHYFVTPRKMIHRSVQPAISKSLNIKFLTYDDQNNHAYLKDAIMELKNDVDLKRQDLQQSGDW